MCRELLEDYARLLTVDTRACAELFARDAEFRTHLGSHELLFTGRHEIQRFLRHVPRQIQFRAGACHPESPGAEHGPGYRAELVIRPDGLPVRTRAVRFHVVDGRFSRFQLLPLPATHARSA